MPIRVRLAFAFALATLVLVAVGGALFSESFSSGLRSSLEPGLRTRAAALSAVFRSQVAHGTGQPQVVDERDDVAQLFDRSGRVLLATTEAGKRPVVDASVIRRARRSEQFADANVGGEREPYRVLTKPDRSGRVILVGTSLEPTDAAVNRVRNALLIGGGIAVVAAGIGGWVLAGAALRPVERMRRTAAEISERDVSARLPVPATHDELQALATTMNLLLADLQEALQRQRAFVADAGHELRTPLAVLRTELELAGRPMRTPDELRDAVEHAARETDRLEQLARDLLFLAKRDDGTATQLEVTTLAPMVEEAVDAAQARAGERQVRIELHVDPTATARVSGALLRPAVDNLLTNALRFSPSGSTVMVRLHRDEAVTAIDVLDEGPGFPPEFLPHAFDRFSRGDPARSRDGGAGLGLSIVRAVAEAHGGSVEAVNRPGGGAIVTIRIPTIL